MPLPSPKKGEKEDKWMSRCMSNENVKKEFPKMKQRKGFCYTQWNRNKGE